jgi:hypothetical protein
MGRKAPCEGSEERRRGTAAATVTNPTARVSRVVVLKGGKEGQG